MRGRRDWRSLSRREQRGLQIGIVVQIGLFLFALQDWIRRPSEEIRGRKGFWFPALFVNFVGPLAYLIVGRQR